MSVLSLIFIMLTSFTYKVVFFCPDNNTQLPCSGEHGERDKTVERRSRFTQLHVPKYMSDIRIT